MSGTIHPEIFNICEGVAFEMKKERRASQWKTWLAKASFVHAPSPANCLKTAMHHYYYLPVWLT